MFDKLNELINSSESVAIFVHVNPDGDALGSAVAMREYLTLIGKKADIYSNDEIAILILLSHMQIQ